MKCLVPGLNVKIFGRAIHAMAKIGDELYIESLANGLVLKTINSAESAYCMVVFSKAFFTYYCHDFFTTEDGQGICQCKISMKSALSVFKSPTHMDKQVEVCEIKLDPDGCKLVFQLRCKHGIVKTHFLSIQDCRKIEATFSKNMLPNRLCTQHRVLSEAVSNFQTTEDQVTIEVNPQTFYLRNYTDSLDSSKIIRTQLCLKPAEFDHYAIGIDTNITFTMKEFRAVLSFAEALNLPISLQFETTGKPAVFIIENNTTFEANFVMATEPSDSGSQQTASTTQVRKNSTLAGKKRNNNVSKFGNSAVHKKSHIQNGEDLSKCLDQDSDLFNFIDIPDESVLGDKCINKIKNISIHAPLNGDASNTIARVNNETKRAMSPIEDYSIPNSPICSSQVRRIRTVFKRCFEATLDPTRARHLAVLADDSDGDE